MCQLCIKGKQIIIFLIQTLQHYTICKLRISSIFLWKYSYFLCKVSALLSTKNWLLLSVLVCPDFLPCGLLHIKASTAQWVKYYCDGNLWSFLFLSSRSKILKYLWGSSPHPQISFFNLVMPIGMKLGELWQTFSISLILSLQGFVMPGVGEMPTSKTIHLF